MSTSCTRRRHFCVENQSDGCYNQRMDTIIIACRTLEDEIELAKKNTGCNYPVRYIESGLHERPKKLAEALVEVFSKIDADQKAKATKRRKTAKTAPLRSSWPSASAETP